MTDPIKFMPPRVALTDPRTGLISREWYLFFQGVYDRIGGANGASIPDVTASLFEDAGSGETNAMLFTVEDAVKQSPSYEHYVEQTVAAELSGLRDQVAEMAKELDALKANPIFEPSGGASPSASIGLAAVSGVATGFMRSDAAPALSQAISPTWTGNHTFGNSTGSVTFDASSVVANAKWRILAQTGNTTRLFRITDYSTGADLDRFVIDANGNAGFGAVPGGTYKVEINGSLSISSSTLIRTATSLTNGAGAVAGTLGNAPVAGNPTKWVPINDNGTTRYIPCW
jgi:hypothetical protein